MKEVCTHYCGRPNSFAKAKGNPIDLSILGNPFWMETEADRERVITQHRADLWRRLQQPNSPEAAAILSIPDDATIGCFCAPKPCHCDIIPDVKRYLLTVTTKGESDVDWQNTNHQPIQ